MSSPDRVVEVFYPRQAPHLAPIAAKMEAEITRQLEALPHSTLEQLLEYGAEIVRDREAFERVRRRRGIKLPGE